MTTICDKCLLLQCCCEADRKAYLEADIAHYHFNSKPTKQEFKIFIQSRPYRKGRECSCERHTALDDLTDDKEISDGLYKILLEDFHLLCSKEPKKPKPKPK